MSERDSICASEKKPQADLPRLPRRGRDLTGQRIGRWTVLELVGLNSRRQRLWLCRCDCGTEKQRTSGTLNAGVSKSCGCRIAEVQRKRLTTHGATRSPEYQCWQNMLDRCLNADNKDYDHYGGRGIAVCAEWQGSFEAFFAHVGSRPSRTHSLDRYPNNDGNYEPGNVRWATKKEQIINSSKAVLLTHGGRTMCLSDWAKELGIYSTTLAKRLRNKWPLDMALTTPKLPDRLSHLSGRLPCMG